MSRFFIHLYRDAGRIRGAMPGESIADHFARLLLGDDVVKLQPNQLEHRRTGMDAYTVIIEQRTVVFDADFNNGINISALFYLSIGIGGLAHQ